MSRSQVSGFLAPETQRISLLWGWEAGHLNNTMLSIQPKKSASSNPSLCLRDLRPVQFLKNTRRTLLSLVVLHSHSRLSAREGNRISLRGPLMINGLAVLLALGA